ncbi:hypothetical protein O181_125003 [Austropuccinia psidii MF-1]|uniref:Uncharacterized protein n=1 Tax=Austropuccinia psidii MF-1 TaxID=1389203 RepID=A0A9Q3Q4M6_9BASI|nr:hypothetical protein [Austropuccinia psidii MF-1]
MRNSQSCDNIKMNNIEQLLNTLPRMSTPLSQNEGTGIPNPQVLDIENSQLKNEISTSFHNLEPSMGQALLKEVPKLKEWPHFGGEGEYDHMSQGLSERNTRVSWHSAIRELTWKTPKE